jgi:hypothetical protein
MDDSASLPEVFSLWQGSAAAPYPAVSFGVAESSPQAEEDAAAASMPVFRSDLPADPRAASVHLDRLQSQLAASDEALETAPARIEALVAQAQAAGRGGIAFDSAASVIGVPEAEALSLLANLDQRAGAPGKVSFGIEQASNEDLDQASAEFQSATGRLWQMVTHLAWVETRLQGNLIGRTTVSWGGAMDTFWEQPGLPDAFELHRRSLALAVASRFALVRMFFVVTQGAVKLSALLTTPAGAALALPVAWRFVNQVRSEIQQYKQLSTQIGD